MRVFVHALLAFCAAPMMPAQGLVNFANDLKTLVSAQMFAGGPYQVLNAPAGSFYFGLFIGSFDFKHFTGVYGTNIGPTAPGLFTGGTVGVPGWPAGVTTNFFVAAWDVGAGHDFQPAWIPGRGGPSPTFFGYTYLATEVAAGNGSTIPTPTLFDGGPGTLLAGISMNSLIIPEPSTTSLVIIGTGVFLGAAKRARIKRRDDTSLA